MSDGFFSSSVVTTGIENADNPEANTYSIIGMIDPSNFVYDDGYYWLELQYHHVGGSNDILTWTQTSWITESTIVGADLFGVSNTETDCRVFEGLGLSSSTNDAYLDGNGADTCWWNAVASIVASGDGFPGHNGKTAVSSSLYLRRPGL